MLDESLLITLAGAAGRRRRRNTHRAMWIRGLDDAARHQFHFPATTVVAVAIAAVVLGVLAAILPARRAARLKLIEALTYE